MKTNVNMIRKMGDFDVVQRTKDSFFNATTLAKQWNKNKTKGRKDVSNFLENKNTKEFLGALKEELNTETRNLVSIQRGKNQGTWMHPYAFIKFAMWLNPKFEVKVIKFVYDELIKDRHLAGDYYSKLCSLLAPFPQTDYNKIGRMLNLVVFNNHKKGLRNLATPKQEKDLQQLERDMCRDIENGYIKSFEQFKQAMRKEWRKRHVKEPELLIA